MDIIFQAHHAAVSPQLRERAERSVRKAARGVRRAVDAVIRFEGDGPDRRVEIVVHAPRHKALVAEGRDSRFGPALATAIARLEAQARQEKRTRRAPGIRSVTA